jgi:hypothetical protein
LAKTQTIVPAANQVRRTQWMVWTFNSKRLLGRIASLLASRWISQVL